MERLLETLLREARSTLPALGACGCDECLTARRSNAAEGMCRAQRRQLEDFLAVRLRRRPLRGATAHARLVEDARRFARLQALLAPASMRARLDVAGVERRLDAYPIERMS